MSSFRHDTRDLAETYDRVSDGQFERGQRLVERLGVEAGVHVLDVGCGTGRLAQWIADRVGAEGSVTGVDPLADRIDIARARAPGVRFEVAQAEDLGLFAESSFDTVCMSSVFHWIEDKAKALSEVRRVLRTGGRLGATTFPHELTRKSRTGGVLERVLKRPPYAGHVDLSALTFAKRGYTTTDIINVVMESGLELVELHVGHRARSYGSGEELMTFMEASTFGNFLRIVPEEQRTQLRAELVAAYDADKGGERFEVLEWGLVFVARRV